MASIDQRIVELKFNGKNFQSGILAAIRALDNLKKNLKMDKAAGEFNKIEKASEKVTFRDLYDNVDSISNRFSTLGIVGMTALSNITTAAMQTGKRLLSALTDPLIAGGKRRALNIEQAKFQIEGLGYAWEQVEGDINYGVKDTAYGLDAAAKAASQLLASQVKVGDEMKASLRGISGVAAMTSSEYEDIANIFTTVAGNGRLMGDQLMQLSSRGLNAAATLGQYLGKSEAEVRQMTSKGQIDFATFAAAMDSAFGEHAKKANETFTGSLSNMKAALSRIGANFATPAYQNLRDIFNSLTPVIDGVNKALTPLVDTAKEGMKVVKDFVTNSLNSLGGKEGVVSILASTMEKLNRLFKAFGSVITNVGRIIKNIVTPILSAFGEVLLGSLIDVLAGAAEILAKFTNSLVFTERMSNNLKKIFTAIFTVVNVLFRVITKIVSVVSDVLLSAFAGTFGFVADVILAIAGHIATLIIKIHDFVMELYKLETVQKILSTIASIFTTIRNVVNKAYSMIREFIGVLIDKTFESSLWVFDKIASAILLIARFIDRVIQAIAGFVERLKELPAVQKFIETMANSFSILKANIDGTSDSIKTKFTNAFNNAKRILGSFISKVKELLGQYIKLPSMQEMVANFQTFIGNVFEKSVEIFNNAKEILGNVLDRIAELNEVSLKAIIENFGKLKDRIIEVVDVSGKLKFLGDLFNGIKEGAANGAEATIDTLSLVKMKLAEFVDWIKGKFAQLTMGDIIAASIGATVIPFLFALTKFIKTAEKLTGALKSTVDIAKTVKKSIENISNEFGALLKAKAWAARVEAISDVIKSVVLLAAAIALLASMDQEKVKTSAAVLLILAGGLIALTAAMAYIEKNISPETIAKSTASLISTAGSLLILVVALRILADTPMEGIATRLVVMGVLMAELAGLMIVLDKFAPELEKSTVSVLAIAAAMLLLSRAIQAIGSLDTGSMISAMAVMTIMMTMLGIMVKVSDKAKLTKSAAIAILGIVIAMRLMIGSIEKLADMDSGKINTGLTRLLEIIGVLSLVMLSTKVAGQYAWQAGVALIAMSVAMNLMVVALKGMASIDNTMLSAASRSLTSILAVFAIITAMTKFAGKNAVRAGLAIMLMAGALAVISAAMMILAKLNDKELARATVAIDSILAMFAIVVVATSQIKQAEKTLTIIAITLGVLVAALAILALIEPRNLLSASLAMSMLLATFALVVASTGQIKKASGTIALMGVVVLALAGILKWLSDQPWENTLAAGTALSEMLLSFSAAALILSKIGPLASASIGGAAAFLGLVVAFGAVLGVLGGLVALIPGAEDFLKNGLPIISLIGQAIGNFVGGIVGGIAAGASDSLVILANNLTAFMEALQPFMDLVRDVDDSVIDGTKKVVEMVLLFAAADFVDGLNFFGGSGSAIINMSKFLPKLGEAMKSLADSLSGVNIQNLKAGVDAAKVIAEIANMTREGGLVGDIFGSSSEGMKSLTENLPEFGRALVLYSEAVDGLDSALVQNSVEPAKALIEIANSINGEGGILQGFLGSNSQGLQQLSENLPGLGDALVLYSKSLDGLDADAVNSSIEPTKSLVDISNSIDSEGGLLQGIIGSTALGNALFAKNLENLGKALTAYSRAITKGGGINTEAIRSSVEPLKSLIEVSKTVDSEGGMLQGIIGSKALGDALFVKNLENLGRALRTFSKSVDGISAESVWPAIDIANAISGILQGLQPVGGLMDSIFGNQESAFSKFNSNLVGLGVGLNLFSQQVSGITGAGIEPSVQAANGIASVVKRLAPEGGLMQQLFGGKMAAMQYFAENLSDLGYGISTYCNQVSGIDMSGVSSSVQAIIQIVKMSQSMDAVGGVSSFLFGDKQQALEALSNNIKRLGDALGYIAPIGSSENQEAVARMMSSLLMVVNSTRNLGDIDDLTTAGDKLVYFGNTYKTFSSSISTVDFAAVQSGVYWLNELFNVMRSFPEIDGTAANFSIFVTTVRNVGVYTVDSFVQALQDGSTRAGTAAYEMMNFAINQAKKRLEMAKMEFQMHGQLLAIMLGNGIRNGATHIRAGIESALSQSISVLNNYKTQFYNSGVYLSQGLANGIDKESWRPVDSVEKMCKRCLEKAQQVFDQASPSKAFAKIGMYNDQGLARGTLAYAKEVFAAIDTVGEGAKEEMLSSTRGMTLGFDEFEPVITPELDLSRIDQGMKDLDSKFAKVDNLSLNVQNARLSSAFGNISKKEMQMLELQNGTPQQVINNFDMTQNNYSPKALSRIDIYRQTSNQISRLKGVVTK